MNRIGYVLKVFPRLSQTFVVNELRALQRAGVDLVVFSLKRPKPEDVELVDHGVTFNVQYLDESRDVRRELANRVTEYGIHHLHAHFGNVAAETARLAARLAGITWSFTAHARDIYDAKVSGDELRRKIAEATAVVTVSDYNIQFLQNQFGRRPILVRNGMPLIDMSFHPTRDSNVILAVGRLIEKKGFDVLIDACQLLTPQIEFECRIVGDGPLREQLQQQIERHRLTGQVKMLGSMSPADVHDQMQQAALLVAPCVIAESGDRDGMPTVLLEAMALGTPVVSTDVTGIPEIVRHAETGLVVPQHEPHGLADACDRLLRDKELARRLALNARSLIERDYDNDRTANVLRQIWVHPPRRIVFRIHNRRGLGHLMRSLNIAVEVLRQQPATDIVFYTRQPPPIDLPPGIRCVVARHPDEMPLDISEIRAFDPHLVVDDVILKDGETGARRILVLRELAAEKHQELLANPHLSAVDWILVPHSEEEFTRELPHGLMDRTSFVGPVVRTPNSATIEMLRHKYSIEPQDFVLVSTVGGGGFDDDATRLFETAGLVHTRITQPHLKHIVVRGPNATQSVQAVDQRMQVVDVEPELPSLFALANATISAGGYNSANEIRAAKCPAFFLPGKRKYDDQAERVWAMAKRGLGWVVAADATSQMADEIAKTINRPDELDVVRKRYAIDLFEPGNNLAAEIVLAVATSIGPIPMSMMNKLVRDVGPGPWSLVDKKQMPSRSLVLGLRSLDQDVIAKTDWSTAETQNVRALQLLQPQPFEFLKVPQLLAFDNDSRCLITERLPGRHCHAMALRESGGRLVRIGKALKELHSAPISLGETTTMADHLAELVSPQPHELATAYPEFEWTIRTATERWPEMEADWEPVPGCPIHRDFHLRQLVDDGQKIGVVDWGFSAQGDPLFDVAYFVSYLRTHDPRMESESAIKDFLMGYGLPENCQSRLLVYEQFNYLRRACRRFRLRDNGWQMTMADMLQRLSRAVTDGQPVWK